MLVDADDAVWETVSHDGSIALPDGETMPAVVTSFTSSGAIGAFFVMSTPTVWRDAGVSGGALDLETLMVAVLLHEASHVVQLSTYGLRVDDIQRRFGLPDSFGDDSLQERFEQEQAFTRSIARETDLFFEAAFAEDDDTAWRLAYEARELMRARAARWFIGEETYWREAEDVWLTFEGSGQWIGYHWLTSPWGADVTPAAAMEGFGRRSRWWSQNQGLSIALTLDRLSGPVWRRQAFGEGRLTLLEMLDELLAR
ncbi:MAG: hypothetical protein R3315_02490 [Woeseiaceae bacterium]|nr:hypothetical protein [Woeseiaceae bacterium]